MYTKRKLVFQLLFLICVVNPVVAQTPAITLPELRQVVTDSREPLTTAHLVYIEELNDNRPIDGNENSIAYKLKKIHNHRRVRVDTIFDCKTKELKSSMADLRDIDALLKEHNLPPEQKETASQWTRTFVIQDPYEMNLLGINVLDAPPDLILSKCIGQYYGSDLIYLGIINKIRLSGDFSPTLTEINSNGRSLLRIELTRKGQNATKATTKIDCDPSLGYRFRRIEYRSADGRLIWETIADDYRDVNDVNGVVPFPFLYIHRSFDKDGKILRERKYVFEDVRLGVDLSANDFKIFVPSGTVLLDVALSMTTHKIEQGGYMGIDDALDVGKSYLLKQKQWKNLNKPEGAKQPEKILPILRSTTTKAEPLKIHSLYVEDK